MARRSMTCGAGASSQLLLLFIAAMLLFILLLQHATANLNVMTLCAAGVVRGAQRKVKASRPTAGGRGVSAHPSVSPSYLGG